MKETTWIDIAIKSFGDNLSSVYTGTLYDWAKDNVNLPTAYAIQGSFNIDNSPYLKMPMDYLLKPMIRQVNCIAATQTGKTMTRELMIPYIILLEPGPILCLNQNDDVAKHMTETRLIPLLKNNKKINALLENDRFQARKSGIVFPHMAIKCCGGSENNLHSLSIKYLFMDETWLMDAGVIAKAKARTTAFNNTKKIFISSQPGVVGDDTSNEINKSEVYEWFYKCKHCSAIQPYVWYGVKDGKKYGMVYDKKLRKDGTFDMDGTAESSRLVCANCHGEIIDTYDNRRYLNENGTYVKTKDGNSENVTFMWSAFVNPTISFKQMTMQYLESINIFKRTGNDDTYKLFVQQVLGKEWDKQGVIEAPRILNYVTKKDETWADETHRFMSVDYQKINGVRYYVIRAWSNKTNESRLLKRGYVTNWEEIAELAKEYKLPPYCIGVDSGYQATEVYAASIQHGQLMVVGKNRIYATWLCFKGNDKVAYKHKDESYKYYSQEVKGDPNFGYGHKFKGINARLYLWAGDSIKTILANLRDNKIESYRWMADVSDKVYIEQMHSEVLKDFIDMKTNTTKQKFVKINENNHYWDCECMNLTMAIMAGAYNTGQIEKPIELDTI